MAKVQRRTLGYISDQETRIDLLRNEAIASTVIRLIDERYDRSITIGIHGDWGAGKSSVLEMIEAGLSSTSEADSPVVCLKFNGWQFQGFEDAKIAVIEGVVTELIAKRTFLTKATDEVQDVLKHINWLKAAKRLGGLAFNAFTGLPSPDQISDLLSVVARKLQDPSTFITKENAAAVANELNGLWKEVPEGKSVPEEIREFHKAFSKLMTKAKVDRLVVLVDDLDRCLPETAVETLEAIRLFVSLPKTVFVIGADEAMIKYAVKRHFPDLPEGGIWADYPRAYLEKLIQVPFRIPTMGEAETRTYVTMLLLGALIGEETKEFETLIEVARRAMSKPWERKSIEEDLIKHVLGATFTDEIRNAVMLSNRITPLLARGTKGNPRQVKRFLNALNLRLQVSDERGFADAIDAQILAKIMLAESFLPVSVFEHIVGTVATAPDGKCAELLIIEEQAQTAATANTETPTATNPVVDDWLTRPDVIRWAKIDPKLGAQNLQPYLFVINDVKNYVGFDAPLSPKLKVLFEKLTGGEASARSVSQELKTLATPDVELLVRELRTKANASTSFTERPDALTGLGETVLAHPAFAMRYIEVLEELPAERLGVWAASGHDRYVGGSARSRLESLFSKWKAKGTPQLKIALDTRKSISKGKP